MGKPKCCKKYQARYIALLNWALRDIIYFFGHGCWVKCYSRITHAGHRWRKRCIKTEYAIIHKMKLTPVNITAPYKKNISSLESFTNNDKRIIIYSVLNSFLFAFYPMCSSLMNVRFKDAFVLTLIKLRRNIVDCKLNHFCEISYYNVLNIFMSISQCT